MPTYANLLVGDPAPWFSQRTPGNPSFVFDSTAGRYIVLCFFASAADARGRAALQAVLARRALFDDVKASFFGVSLDPTDEARRRVTDSRPGLRFFWGLDGAVSRLYGAIPAEPGPVSTSTPLRRLWVVLDPTLRIVKVLPLAADGSCAEEVLGFVAGLPAPTHFAGFQVHAPILVLPNVLEPDLCRHLVGLYEADGGAESGFMRDVGGRTVEVRDPKHKRRRDHVIEDAGLQARLRERIARRVVPEIAKVHQFAATRMERYIVSCYRAEDGGHFRAHRDNTTKGTAHRRFAVSVNLNAGFEGGGIGFPEYGPATLKPPPGGAVVFSCSLLHAVSKVTAGRRYAFLPFLYDDAAARVREANAGFLEGGAYTAGVGG